MRADLISRFGCRLMNHMDVQGLDTVTPRAPADFQLPKQGDRDPWQNRQDYKFDKSVLMKAALEHDGLVFSSSKTQVAA